MFVSILSTAFISVHKKTHLHVCVCVCVCVCVRARIYTDDNESTNEHNSNEITEGMPEVDRHEDNQQEDIVCGE